MTNDELKIKVEDLSNRLTFETGEVWYEGPMGSEIPKEIYDTQPLNKELLATGGAVPFLPEFKSWEHEKSWDTKFNDLFPCGDTLKR